MNLRNDESFFCMMGISGKAMKKRYICDILGILCRNAKIAKDGKLGIVGLLVCLLVTHATMIVTATVYTIHRANGSWKQ